MAILNVNALMKPRSGNEPAHVHLISGFVPQARKVSAELDVARLLTPARAPPKVPGIWNAAADYAPISVEWEASLFPQTLG